MISNLKKIDRLPGDRTDLGNVHEDLSACTDCTKWLVIRLQQAKIVDGRNYLYFELRNQEFERITDVVISDARANEITVRTENAVNLPSSDYYEVETDINFSSAATWQMNYAIEKKGRERKTWVFIKN